MIQKVITKYGLAFHLAMLAALPSALAPLVSSSELGRVVLWLSFIGVLWIFIEPSIRKGEHLSVARMRVFAGIVRDPVAWFFLVMIFFAGVRWLNSGLGLVYDIEKVSWSVSEPAWSVFPSSVEDEGFLPFTVVAACAVVVLGLRHAVGLSARVSFGMTGAFVSGAGGVAVSVLACIGMNPFASDAVAGFGVVREPLFGALYGIWLFVALGAGAHAEQKGWSHARIVHCLTVGGNIAGLVFFAPPLVASSYLALAAIYALYCWIWVGRAGSKGAVAKNLVFTLLGVVGMVLAFLMFAPAEIKDSKLAGLDPSVAWKNEVHEADVALSGMAKRMWLKSPWSGVGLGAFRLQAPFVAQSEDWEVVPPNPARAINGYWNLLSERGSVICALVAVGIGLLIWSWVARGVEAFLHLRTDAEFDVFPFSCPPIVWIPLFFIPLVAVEGVFAPAFSVRTLFLAAAAALALATASFPRRSVDKQKEAS